MALNGSLLRNVYFYDATNPDVTLGGLFQNGSITEANFLDILGIILMVEWNPVQVQERVSGHIVCRTDLQLKKGVYDIYCDGMCSCSRDGSFCQYDRFRNNVCNLDRRCVISGLINPEAHIQANNWVGIADIDDTLGTPKIDSRQDGLLLGSGIHQAFQVDQYLISVNPDDNYKIVLFNINIFGWHFRQSILAIARGAGEPIFEHDFPLGHDMVGEILASPSGQERFSLEIASRLRGFPKDNRFRHGETPQLSA
ncbi:hypothetical protein HOY82DRAFT_578460 [Tuber indicum]|nr:hypothetical protein HOY82DRAFT_578460 [Tuber indicum]